MEARLSIIEGKDLKAMDVTGKSDPFVVVKVVKNDGSKPSKIYKTETIDQNLNPVWNETMRLKSGILESSEVESLKFLLYDQDPFTNDFMGIVEIPIAKFKKEFDEWFPLAPKAGKKASSVSGSLHFKCTIKKGGASGSSSAKTETAWDEANKKIASREFAAAVPLLRKAIDEGYLGAQRDLAIILEHGLGGVEEDKLGARKLYTLCSKNGCATSHNNLGYMLQYGIGGTKNTVEAREHYEAAGENSIAALYNYGYCLFTGTGGPIDKVQAREYFHMAAITGYPPALNNLAFCFQYGIGGEKDEQIAVEFYEKAISKGYPAAMVNLGQYLQFVKGGEEDKKKARELYEQAIKADPQYAQAHFCLAYCYEVGAGGPEELSSCRNSYENALKYGEAEAQCALDRLSSSSNSRRKRTLNKSRSKQTLTVPAVDVKKGMSPSRHEPRDPKAGDASPIRLSTSTSGTKGHKRTRSMDSRKSPRSEGEKEKAEEKVEPK